MFYLFIIHLFILSSPNDTFFIALEREKGKEKNIDVERNTNWMPPVHALTRDHMHPDQGLNLKPRYVP